MLNEYEIKLTLTTIFNIVNCNPQGTTWELSCVLHVISTEGQRSAVLYS